MGFLSCICVGLLAGLLGYQVMSGAGLGGLVVSLLLGIAGASVGAVTVGLLEEHWLWGFSVWSMPAAVVGAIALLLLYKLVVRVTA